MKTVVYLVFSIILVVAGIFIVRSALFPPYFSNTIRLLNATGQYQIDVPLPNEEMPDSSSQASPLPVDPVYKNLPFALLGLSCLTIGSLLVYFFPGFMGRSHRDRLSIYILNFFLGWSFLGWVIALIWAVTKDPIFLVEPPQDRVTTQLKELGRLRKDGTLAESEFKKLKNKLINEHTNPQLSTKKNSSVPVKSECPHCTREYQIRPQLVGKLVNCKHCGKRFKL